jgi:hypothetical protein
MDSALAGDSMVWKALVEGRLIHWDRYFGQVSLKRSPYFLSYVL